MLIWVPLRRLSYMKRIATSKDMRFEQRLAQGPEDTDNWWLGLRPDEGIPAVSDEDWAPTTTEADRHREILQDQIADLNRYAQEPTTAPFQLRNKINDILETLDLLENSERPEEEYPHPQAHEGYPGGVSPHDEPPTFGAGNFRS